MPAEPPTKEEDESPVIALDADDIALLKTYGLGPYTASIKVRGWDGERGGGHSIGAGGASFLRPVSHAGCSPPLSGTPGLPDGSSCHGWLMERVGGRHAYEPRVSSGLSFFSRARCLRLSFNPADQPTPFSIPPSIHPLRPWKPT
jgi:hypothetical protein